MGAPPSELGGDQVSAVAPVPGVACTFSGALGPVASAWAWLVKEVTAGLEPWASTLGRMSLCLASATPTKGDVGALRCVRVMAEGARFPRSCRAAVGWARDAPGEGLGSGPPSRPDDTGAFGARIPALRDPVWGSGDVGDVGVPLFALVVAVLAGMARGFVVAVVGAGEA